MEVLLYSERMGMKASDGYRISFHFRNQRYLVGVNLLDTPDDFF